MHRPPIANSVRRYVVGGEVVQALTIECLTTKHLAHGLLPDVAQTERSMEWGNLYKFLGYRGSEGVSMKRSQNPKGGSCRGSSSDTTANKINPYYLIG